MQWTKLGHEKLSPQCWPRAVDTHNFSLTSFAYIRYFGALPVIHLACSPPVLREIVENAYEFEGGEGNKVNSINYFRPYQRIQRCQQAANFEEPTIEFAWGWISLGQFQVYTLHCNNVVLEKLNKEKAK